ncbi:MULTISPECIES: chemotaxis protein CheW [Zoogloea]|jgi:purine-binding chemotaxis protein CheW|uniref:Purine-binding chemotaxis protein CheW n=1 Tax=Zoogloea oleivorans TaxID=1552750 RepID=A0A6C2D4V3_9RHOO|nr:MULTISPECIES: chemotaxis protein CheW [Zoogloea]MBT9498167.1 purine-binding chemotaxis protein CheW [Zoogloea sp.]MDD2670449.1 chemotaxis protein CheW [Zoogloea sp.]TYC60753.1 purine-binding chemotaxis protein CheW [Zoogloea oleivorans]
MSALSASPANTAVAGAKAPVVVESSPAQYLTFLLGGEMFAVGILNIKEIIEYGAVTEIPMVPPFIRGVINLRGAVVPVIDLASRFGGKRSEISRRTCIVIIELTENDERQDIGVVVDAVSEVLEIPVSEIEPPPSFGARIRADFIKGMGKVNGKFVILLEVDKVLSVDEISSLSRIATEGVDTVTGGTPAA